MKISCDLPQNDPEGTEMTQGDYRYGDQALCMYWVLTNFYDILNGRTIFIPILGL